MNNFSLQTKALAELHTGLAEIVDGKSLPNMNFGNQVNAIEENLNVTATRLNFE